MRRMLLGMIWVKAFKSKYVKDLSNHVQFISATSCSRSFCQKRSNPVFIMRLGKLSITHELSEKRVGRFGFAVHNLYNYVAGLLSSLYGSLFILCAQYF